MKREVCVRYELMGNGLVTKKTIKTFRSDIGLLKLFKKQAEPNARIMDIKGVLTLVCHNPLSTITIMQHNL